MYRITCKRVLNRNIQKTCIYTLIFTNYSPFIHFSIMASNLDKTTSAQNRFRTSDLPSSGFNLGYVSHRGTLQLGRCHVTSYQHIMAGDKFQGSNAAKFTFNDIVTPVVSPVNISHQNYFVTLRSIDSQIPAMFNPTERNNMSKDLRCPTFTMRNLFGQAFANFLCPTIANESSTFLAARVYNNVVTHFGFYDTDALAFVPMMSNSAGTAIITRVLKNKLKDSYCGDILDDLYPALRSTLNEPTSTTWTPAEFCNYLNYFADLFIGEGSLLDDFGYPCWTHKLTQRLVDYIVGHAVDYINVNEPEEQIIDLSQIFDSLWTDFVDDVSLDDRTFNEYPLRAYYAIWYEYYRKPDVEKQNASLPDYRTFGSTPIISLNSDFENFAYLLVTRVRAWGRDMFNCVSPDDIYRHIYAPTFVQTGINYSTASPYEMAMTTQGSKYSGELLSSMRIPYFDAQNQTTRWIDCPVPDGAARQSSIYTKVANTFNDFAALDLKMLQRTEQMARYLKRVALGDEYRDYMLNQYGAVLEDYRINRPMLIGQSIDAVDIQQKVAQAGKTASKNNESGTMNQRLAMANGAMNGSDGFSMYASEFGLYIGITSMLPLPQYDYECPQNRADKLTDFPVPVLANNQEEIMDNHELSRTPISFNGKSGFGHVGYAHAWKQRPNEVHGDYLSQRWDYCFTRFFGAEQSYERPVFNSTFLHCHPSLPMFADTILLNGQAYGMFEHNFLVERHLPQDIELI